MKSLFLAITIVSLSVTLMGCSNNNKSQAEGEKTTEVTNEATTAAQTEQQQTDSFDEAAATTLVESFGNKLKEVSLLAPKDSLKVSMQESYGDFVSPDLLEKWNNDPLNAPGRLTSSPWPERIEVESVEKLPDNSYEVKGKVIELTSEEVNNGGIAASRPITLKIKKIAERWLISAVTLGRYEDSNVLS